MISKNRRRTAFADGCVAFLPTLPSVTPFAMICGITVVKSGISPLAALTMSSLIYCGASQLIFAQLFASNGSPLVIVFTASIINLRLAMYSASLAPHFQHLGKRWRWPVAYLITDLVYAITISHYSTEPKQRYKEWFYLGNAVTMWLIWQLGNAAGAFLGASVPTSWSLDFAIPLTFIALLMMDLRDRAALAAAVAAGGVALIGINLPYNLGLILAAIIGILAGLSIENLQTEKVATFSK